MGLRANREGNLKSWLHYFLTFSFMKNTLDFAQLQHLYVVLNMTDCRTVESILSMAETFGKTEREVAILETKQENEIRAKARPLIQEQKKQMSEGADTTKVDAEIQLLDKELKALQRVVPEFEWDENDKKTIQLSVCHVLETHGTGNENLGGMHKIAAMAAIIKAFEIKDGPHL